MMYQTTHLSESGLDCIDFVVTWVDGSDREWQKEKERYSDTGNIDDNVARYREWGLFRYWFRGVEKFAPWVRKIHLVTWGHLPSWLNTENSRLHIVRHEDYIPKKFLPTFNSNVLEIYLHKIEGLSDRFIYFNDDVYLIRDIGVRDFFRWGKPCDMLAFQPIIANPSNPVMSHLYLNNSLVLCKYFNKRENVWKNPGNYFRVGYPPLYFFYNMLEMMFPQYTGFYTVHGPSPFCRKTFLEVWERERRLLEEMSFHRFRSVHDVTPYLFREWQKLSGNFYPRNIQKDFRYYEIQNNNKVLLQNIRKQRHKVICINDANVTGDFERIQRELHASFEQILPEKSGFEL